MLISNISLPYSSKTYRSFLLCSIMLLIACLLSGPEAHCAKSKKDPTWEEYIVKGNEYKDRGRYFDSRRYYENALRLLDKDKIRDVRRALVLNDIAESYRGETNDFRAKMAEVEAHGIYKEEIKSKQLGYEYSSKKPISINSSSLRPACFICHENWKVVPILYGESTGYDGETPDDSDTAFTHKPGGKEYADQRWYCRECHQSF